MYLSDFRPYINFNNYLLYKYLLFVILDSLFKIFIIMVHRKYFGFLNNTVKNSFKLLVNIIAQFNILIKVKLMIKEGNNQIRYDIN